MAFQRSRKYRSDVLCMVYTCYSIIVSSFQFRYVLYCSKFLCCSIWLYNSRCFPICFNVPMFLCVCICSLISVCFIAVFNYGYVLCCVITFYHLLYIPESAIRSYSVQYVPTCFNIHLYFLRSIVSYISLSLLHASTLLCFLYLRVHPRACFFRHPILTCSFPSISSSHLHTSWYIHTKQVDINLKDWFHTKICCWYKLLFFMTNSAGHTNLCVWYKIIVWQANCAGQDI